MTRHPTATASHPASSNRPARRRRIRRRSAHGAPAVTVRDALVDEARRALRLVLWDVPSARPSQARSGALGAATGGNRAAAVVDAASHDRTVSALIRMLATT